MKIDILTLFPSLIEPFLNESIIKRAIEKKLVSINIINIRDFSEFNNHQVDDTPYGGGSGMVIMCDPVYKAIESVKNINSKVIVMSPRGKTYNQQKANELKALEHIILLCGHYEGFDERIYELCDEEISVGDYILTGGEIPGLTIVDTIVRLIPGVITEGSLESESFSDNLLDYPVYTKPRVYNDMEVPDILLSGDHKKIDEYRQEMRKIITAEKRPDLLN